MVSAKNRYRRVTVTRMDGKEEAYNARVDVETDPATGRVTYRIHSQVLEGKCFVFHSCGNASEDVDYLEEKCQQMFNFDQGFRIRPAPKPGGEKDATSTPAVTVDACTQCGGQGYTTDEWGYDDVCGCRR